jgi:hypothetical protein
MDKVKTDNYRRGFAFTRDYIVPHNTRCHRLFQKKYIRIIAVQNLTVKHLIDRPIQYMQHNRTEAVQIVFERALKVKAQS